MSEREVIEVTPRNLVGRQESNEKVLIVDVRDSDYGEGGVIQGSMNLPMMLINLATATDLINRAKDENYASIIFYCKYGQQRSVKAAKTVNMVLCKMDPIPLVQIGFLKGGFDAFLKVYQGTEHVVSK